MRQFVSSKNCYASSKQGRRLRFGKLTILTNIRSTMVLHHASCIKGRRLRFGMLTDLKNIRSNKVSWQVENNLWWKTTFVGRQPSVERKLLSRMLSFGMLTFLTNIRYFKAEYDRI